jgi:hypothetical protein
MTKSLRKSNNRYREEIWGAKDILPSALCLLHWPRPLRALTTVVWDSFCGRAGLVRSMNGVRA